MQVVEVAPREDTHTYTHPQALRRILEEMEARMKTAMRESTRAPPAIATALESRMGDLLQGLGVPATGEGRGS